MEEFNGGGNIYMKYIIWFKNAYNSGFGQYNISVDNIILLIYKYILYII